MSVTTEPARAADLRRVERLVDALLDAVPPSRVDAVTFLGEQFDRGLAWIHFPRGAGGLGLSPSLQQPLTARLAAAGAPSALARNFIGIGMCAPTLVAWGTDEQRRLLRPLFTGEQIWCQMFSEPGAGSDVAGLGARAVLDGDEWVVNGEKVWTTLAHVARWGLLLVRTDPDVVKHAGLSAFVLDMRLAGVEIRPLRQMTGDAEFNEVFLTDVCLPRSAMLGRPGDGWRVALTTLMNERTSIGGALPERSSSAIGELVRRWRSLPEERRDAVSRDRIAALWIRAAALRLSAARAGRARASGEPGPEGSVLKLAAAELTKEVWAAIVDLMGAEGMLYGSYEMVRSERAMAFSSPQKAFLRSRASSIEGGTTEVMKNIIAERVLGLPPDVRADRDIPWSAVPRARGPDGRQSATG